MTSSEALTDRSTSLAPAPDVQVIHALVEGASQGVHIPVRAVRNKFFVRSSRRWRYNVRYCKYNSNNAGAISIYTSTGLTGLIQIKFIFDTVRAG